MGLLRAQKVRSCEGVMVPAAVMQCAEPLMLSESKELAAGRHQGSELVERLLPPLRREAVALVKRRSQGAQVATRRFDDGSDRLQDVTRVR